MPPDNCHGNLLPKPDSSTSAITRSTRSACSALENPMISKGSETFRAIVRHGYSPAAWNT